MLTGIKIRNFKRFEDVQVELGKAVVFIGPNNSGKTTALQAIALWDIGIRRWVEKRKESKAEKRPGITINRRDLVSIPVPVANLLWRNLHVRDVARIKGKQQTKNIRVDIIMEGVTNDRAWSCGLEFDYANDESFYCRPLRLDEKGDNRMQVPEEVVYAGVAYLPPMSGLADREYLKQQGEIGFLIGQGQTAQVLRNLCYQIHDKNTLHWDHLLNHIKGLFGVELLPPRFVAERSEITMAYKDEHNNILDLSSSGRGLQQTLLLLAHLYSNPGDVLLLDEPDAHLEILRQRDIYNLLIEVAEQQGSQIIAASHSEVILNEAAGRDTVVAFVGKPHLIDKNKSAQVMKALRNIGFDDYYKAEETGWVLYLEGSTDLAILKAFAKTLEHEAQNFLGRLFVHYLGTNLPEEARKHFFGLKEAKSDIVGIAIFDRLEKELQTNEALVELMWNRKEIENYFCSEDVLLAYVRHERKDNDLQLIENDLFGRSEIQQREQVMKDAIAEIAALQTLNRPGPWSPDIKATDDFLDPLFKRFFEIRKLPLELRKSEYHILASLVAKEALDKEITEKLDAIVTVVKKAKPRTE